MPAASKVARMSKLLRLKRWVTLDEAARRITAICEETVTEADVLQLALEGHIKLAVHLINGACARACQKVDVSKIEYDQIPSFNGRASFDFPKNGRVFTLSNGLAYQVSKEIHPLGEGVWDLPLFGSERQSIEKQFQCLVGGPSVSSVVLDSVFVASTNGELFEIQSHASDFRGPAQTDVKSPWLDPGNFHPAGGLPEDSSIVVRANAIEEFESAMRDADSDKAEEKPLGPREKNTLLKLIWILCSSQKIDAKQPYKAAEIIKTEAELLGIDISIGTIAAKLEEANTLIK